MDDDDYVKKNSISNHDSIKGSPMNEPNDKNGRKEFDKQPNNDKYHQNSKKIDNYDDYKLNNGNKINFDTNIQNKYTNIDEFNDDEQSEIIKNKNNNNNLQDLKKNRNEPLEENQTLLGRTSSILSQKNIQDYPNKLIELINNIKISFIKDLYKEDKRIKVKKICVDEAIYYIPAQFQSYNLIGKGSYGNVLSVFLDSDAKRNFLKNNISYNDNNELSCMAVKYLYAPFRSTFIASRALRELSILRALDHPNLIKLHYAYCVAKENDDLWQIYLCTELAHTNLSNLKKKSLSHSYFSYIIYQIVSGLLHMHDHHIIHRDLKPANIVLYTNCHVKVLDFGLSRMTDIKMTPYVVTRYYRAPEIIFSMEYDEKVDLWSVGCILAEFLLDQILLKGKTSLHQWMLIVDLLGMPKDDFFRRMPLKLASMVKSKSKTIGSGQPKFDRIFTMDVLRRNDSESEAFACLTLLRNLLVIDSYKRWNDQQTLNSDYLISWQQENELDYRDLRIDLDFSFEKETEYNIDAYKDAFRNLLMKSEIENDDDNYDEEEDGDEENDGYYEDKNLENHVNANKRRNINNNLL